MNFILALLTGLGVGSGGLYILYLTLIRGVGQSEAQGLNLIFFITASLAAAFVNTVKKRILWTPVLILFCSGVLGSFLGSLLAHRINEKILSVMFGALLVFVGGAGLINQIKKKDEK